MTEPETTSHVVLGTSLSLPAGEDLLEVFLAGGCFWGVERFLWETPGVVSTAVGYMGGRTKNPTYIAVCTGITGHAEAVRVVYDPSVVSTTDLLAVFFENHDPTQVNRQGNDRGTQYRSAIWTTTETQFKEAENLKNLYAIELAKAGFGPIATQITPPPPPPFYYAEDYHQGYLHKNPNGYCNHGFNGTRCPRGTGIATA